MQQSPVRLYSMSKDIQLLLQHRKTLHASVFAKVFTNGIFDLLNQGIQTDFECKHVELPRDAIPGGKAKPSFKEIGLRQEQEMGSRFKRKDSYERTSYHLTRPTLLKLGAEKDKLTKRLHSA